MDAIWDATFSLGLTKPMTTSLQNRFATIDHTKTIDFTVLSPI